MRFILGFLLMYANVSACEMEAKRLLEWNKEKLTAHANLRMEDLNELFAKDFLVIANGRIYQANYQNYYAFLNQFRSTIQTIDYQVQEYLVSGRAVTMPLKAIVERLDGGVVIFDAIMLLKFDDSGKIIHWQEVYSER